MTGREVGIELASVADSVARARAVVRELGGGLPGRLLDDAELLVSELVSNAVQHGGTAIRLSVSYEAVDGRRLSVWVYDDSSRLPAATALEHGPDVPSGRGLRIVEQIATEWGVDVDPAGRGKTVWFCISEPPASDTGRSMDNESVRDRAAWS